jgi:CRP-like cAMP-binding protein
MSFNLLFENLSRHITLSDADKNELRARFETRTLKRKEFILNHGEVCKCSAFVSKGCLRSYSVDSNGFEHILQFAPGWWIADMHSLISGQPSKLNIEALEESEVLLLPRDQQEQLFRHDPKYERFFRVITEKSIAAGNDRLLDYMGMNAQERYQVFTARYPSLTRTLPQKQIAAYIGVTPEFLSKMKAGMLKAGKTL